MKVLASALTALALVACSRMPAPSPTPTPEPTAIPIATPLPPQFQPSPGLAGRLWLDFGLGSIWAATLSDGAVTEVVNSDGGVFPTQASVPLSGAPIAYAGSPGAGDGFTGRFGLFVGDRQILAPDAVYSYQEPAWQANGSALFFTRVGVGANEPLTRTSGLAIQRLETRDWRLSNLQSPIPKPTTVITNAFQPAPSFDAQWLAYTRVDAADPLNPTRSIRVHNLTTGEDREIVPGSRFYDVYGPRWLPDGRQIVFAAAEGAPSAHGALPTHWLPTVMDAVLGAREAHAHTWNGGVWRINADGSGLVKLVQRDFAAPTVAPSPNGAHIALLTLDGVWVMNADGGDLRQVSAAGGNGAITWSN